MQVSSKSCHKIAVAPHQNAIHLADNIPGATLPILCLKRTIFGLDESLQI